VAHAIWHNQDMPGFNQCLCDLGYLSFFILCRATSYPDYTNDVKNKLCPLIPAPYPGLSPYPGQDGIGANKVTCLDLDVLYVVWVKIIMLHSKHHKDPKLQLKPNMSIYHSHQTTSETKYVHLSTPCPFIPAQGTAHQRLAGGAALEDQASESSLPRGVDRLITRPARPPSNGQAAVPAT
jgi:hypothetical protein